MLRVTIELIPFGDEDFKKEVGQMEVWHESHFPDEEGGYRYGYKLDNVAPFIKGGELNKEVLPAKGEIWGHDRKKNVWSLIKSILNKVEIDDGNL